MKMHHGKKHHSWLLNERAFEAAAYLVVLNKNTIRTCVEGFRVWVNDHEDSPSVSLNWSRLLQVGNGGGQVKYKYEFNDKLHWS